MAVHSWRSGLHVMFGGLLAFGVLRAWVDGRLDARVAVLAAALAVVYVSRLPTAVWLTGLCLLWCGLMVHAEDFMWLEFPLVFAFLAALPRWWGVAASAVLWAMAAFIPAWIHPGSWTVAAAVGPLIGTAFAVGAFHAGRMVQAEAAHHAEVARQLRATQDELAATEHQAGRLEERERLAREIHDTVAQGLSSIVLLSRAARSEAPAHKDEKLALIESVASENLAEARRFVSDLAARGPTVCDGLGELVESLRAQTAALGQDLDVSLVTTGKGAIPADAGQVILRATREALSNVLKHAHASRVVVTLGCFADETTVDIVDDGVGFAAPGPGGYGLPGIRARVAELGGHVSIESSPGAGTAVAIRLPAAQEEAHV